jgi:hypothetical protein
LALLLFRHALEPSTLCGSGYSGSGGFASASLRAFKSGAVQHFDPAGTPVAEIAALDPYQIGGPAARYESRT